MPTKLRRRQPRTQAPQFAAGINWGHPRAEDLVFFAPLTDSHGARDLVARREATRTGWGTQASSGGRSTRLFGSGSRLDFGTAPPQIGISTPFTIAWTQEPRAGAGYSALLAINFGTAGTDPQFVVYQSASDAGYGFVIGPLGSLPTGTSSSPLFSTIGVTVDGRRNRFVARCLGGPSSQVTSDYVVWRDGVRHTTTSTAALSAYRTAAFRLGALSDATDPFEGVIQDVRIWARVLTDAEAFAESRVERVGELYAPRRIWVPVVGGGGSVSLTVSDSTHAHTADNLTLTTTGSTSLAVSDAAHAHTADSLTLTTSTALAVSDALHAHAAESLVLGVTGATNLVVADASHAHNVDGLILTAQSLLAIQDALHAHAADNLTINTAPSLLIANALHAHTSDGLALTVSAWLVVANTEHGHFADVVVFTGAAPDSWIAGDGSMSAPRIGVARNGELWALIVDDDNVPTHAKRMGTTRLVKVHALPGGNQGQVMTSTGVVLVVL